MPDVTVDPEELRTLELQMQKDNDAVSPQMAFTADEYASRLSKLRRAMKKMSGLQDVDRLEDSSEHSNDKLVDVVLLSSPEAQCWLHGYQARWYRTGSTTEWAPCSFTAVHMTRDAVIRVPVDADHLEGDPQDGNHTIFLRPGKGKLVPAGSGSEPVGELKLDLQLTDGFLLFDSSDHKELIQFTSIAGGFCHFDDPKNPKDADATMGGVHKFLVDTLVAQGWLYDGVVIGIEKSSPRQNAATTEDLLREIRSRTNVKNVVVEDITVPLRILQRIKSDAELKVMDAAGSVLEAAFDHVLSADLRVSSLNIKPGDTDPKTMHLHPGMTEMQVWAEMEWAMAQRGGETAGLHNTVSRTRSYCHALSSTRPVGEGPLLLDPCGVKHRYHVNTARQFYFGKQVPAELMKASQIAAGAIDVLHNTAKEGLEFAVVSKALRKYYQDSGAWDLRDWIGGYQLGIAFTPDWVGEFNWNVDLDETKKIKAGLVTNFESFVGGAGFIETIVFLEKGIKRFSKRDLVVQRIDTDFPNWWRPAATT